MQKTIHPFFWFALPVLWIVLQIGFELFVPQDRLSAMHTEGGLVELLQSIPLLAAFVLAVRGAIGTDWSAQKLLGFWFTLAALCTFYVSGEEISWGQHILNWTTPEYWSAVNDQNETNLHNTSAWLDQKPRLLLFLGIFIGGLVVPAFRRWRPSLLPVTFMPLYPSNILIPTALGVVLPYLAQEIAEHFFDVALFTRVSEVQELYMYFFVFLYIWDLQNREKS